MEKFTLLDNTVPAGRNGHYRVIHNISPRCKIEVMNLNIMDAREDFPDMPSKIFEVLAPGGGYYWALVGVYEKMEEGDYDQVLQDCWEWWLKLKMKEDELLEPSEN